MCLLYGPIYFLLYLFNIIVYLQGYSSSSGLFSRLKNFQLFFTWTWRIFWKLIFFLTVDLLFCFQWLGQAYSSEYYSFLSLSPCGCVSWATLQTESDYWVGVIIPVFTRRFTYSSHCSLVRNTVILFSVSTDMLLFMFIPMWVLTFIQWGWLIETVIMHHILSPPFPKHCQKLENSTYSFKNSSKIILKI